MTDYKPIDHDQYSALINSPGAKYEPIGKYIYHDEEAGIWTAIDNSDGEAWTEDFGCLNVAVRWLHGYRAKNIYGEVLEGTR